MFILPLLVLLLQNSASPTFRVVEAGTRSLIDRPRQAVVRTDAEWQQLWRDHAGDHALPPVDFSREMIVALFLGTRPTAGYAVDVIAVREDAGGLVVECRETKPGPGRITAQVLTMPFVIAAVPKRGGEVRFETAGKP